MTREIIKSLLQQGLLPKEIKLLHPNISGPMISKVRGLLGMPKFSRRVKGGHSPAVAENIRRAREMKVAGLSYSEIGQRLSVSHQRAQQYLRVIPPVKSTHCSRCGKPDSYLHYHHTDYAVDAVVPVCNSCHTSITHGEKRQRFEALFGKRIVVSIEEIRVSGIAADKTARKWCREMNIYIVSNRYAPQTLLRDQGLRKCYVCKIVKPLGDFTKASTNRSGRGYRCAECNRISVRQHYRKNLAVKRNSP